MHSQLTGTTLYEATLDNLIEGFQLISFDWKYLYVNESFVKQSTFPRDQLIGSTLMERYPGIENLHLFETLKECMTLRISRNMETEFIYPDNSKIWYELRIQPVPDGIFILTLDISERKKSEEKKKLYREELEQMIHMTSHRIRHPVTQIMSVLNLLDEEKISHKEVKEITGYMKESVLSLDAFTTELTIFINNLKDKAESVFKDEND